MVEGLTELTKSSPRKFGWNDNVADIIFNNASLKSAMISWCSSDDEPISFTTSNCSISGEISWSNVPLFYRLKVKYDESPSRSGVYYAFGVGDDAALPSGYDTYTQERRSCRQHHDYRSGYGGSETITLHSSATKRLDGYYVWASYLVVDEYVSPPVSQDGIIYLGCDTGAVDCD